MEGKILWFDNKKGFGLIKSEEKEYFVHKTNILKCGNYIQENDKVNFKSTIVNDKLNAIDVIVHSVKNKNKYQKKIKNTTDFTPNLNDGDLHLVFTNGKCPDKISSNDLIVIHNFIDEKINYLEQIMNEVKEIKNGEIFKLWHGDSHSIADDKGYDWIKKCPTFNKIIDYISNFFNMDIKATRLNYYKDSNDWKPYHHDAAALKPNKAKTQNFTVAVQFGLTRTVSLQHPKHSTIIDFEISNGQCYAFSDQTNIDWKHGIKQEKMFKNEPRLSIIAWGKI